jgi:hypothetical protein
VDWQERPLIETFYEGIDSTRTKTVEESNSKNFENSKAEVDLVKSALQGDEVRARTRKNSQSTPTLTPMLFRAGETLLSCRHWATLNRPGRPTSAFAQDATPDPASQHPAWAQVSSSRAILRSCHYCTQYPVFNAFVAVSPSCVVEYCLTRLAAASVVCTR